MSAIAAEAPPVDCPRCGGALISNHDERLCLTHGLDWTPVRAWDLALVGADEAAAVADGRVRRGAARHDGPDGDWGFIDDYGDLPPEWWDWACSQAGGKSDRFIGRRRFEEARRRWLAGEKPAAVREPSNGARLALPATFAERLRWVAHRVEQGEAIGVGVVARELGVSEEMAQAVMGGPWGQYVGANP